MEDRQIDFRLMRRIQRGDMEAFDVLMNKYKIPLTGFIGCKIWDRYETEDIVQETFIAVYEKRDLFHYENRFITWLYAIATNKMRDVLRRKKCRPLSSQDIEEKDNIEYRFIDSSAFNNRNLWVSALRLNRAEKTLLSSLYGFNLETGERQSAERGKALTSQGFYWDKIQLLRRSGLKKMRRNIEFLDRYFVKQ